MKKLALILMLLCLFATGCAGEQPTLHSPEESKTEESTAPEASDTVPETQPTQTESETTLPPETDGPKDENTVSSLAEPDYLLPFTDYAWEREFDVEYVVLHFTSNVVNDKANPYDLDAVKGILESTKTSAHYIIDRDGSVKCYIPENYAAWHAGAGTFANDEKYTNKMNKYSIGIEILAIGSLNDMATYLTPTEYYSLPQELIGFTDEQYESLRLLVKDICERYSVPYDREHIIGHEEYNPKKADPGELFDWDRLFS